MHIDSVQITSLVPDGIHYVPTEYLSIQAAINAAGPGDHVVVLPGQYVGGMDLLGKAITVRSMDPANPAVVASAVIHGNRAALHVVTCVNGEDADTILDGLTITGGNANGPCCGPNHGGGMYNEGSSPTVRNCVFIGNSANQFGAGMFNKNSSPTVTGCSFTSNRGGLGPNGFGEGGGMFNNATSHPLVSNCVFACNVVNKFGGAMLNDSGSHPTISHCTFENNTAGVHGGAIASNGTSTIGSSFFCGNTPDHIQGPFVNAGGNTFSALCGWACCTWDCGGVPDGVVSVVDFLALLGQWGQVGSSCDVDGGGVNTVDFLSMLQNWGSCS